MQHSRQTPALKPVSKMPMRSLLSQSLALVLIGAAGSASALSLGGLNVQSTLGQPIRAEIEVIEDRPGEAEGVGLSIATPQQYQAMGLQFNPIINSLIFDAYRRVDNRVFLKITTAQPVSIPYFDLLLVASTPTGELRRQYIFYIGESASTSRQPVANNVTAPAVLPPPQPVVNPVPVTAAPSPAPNVAAAPARDTRATAPSNGSRLEFSSDDPKPRRVEVQKPTSGLVVEQGQTLTRIAAQNAYSGVSLEQMMAALYYGNPHAFINKNINLIKAGSNLKLPTQDEVQSVAQADARKLVRAHSKDFNQYRRALSTVASATTVQIQNKAQTKPIKAEVVDASKAARGDRVELSKGSSVTPASNVAKSATLSEEQKIAQSLEAQEKAKKEEAIKKEIDALSNAQKDLNSATAQTGGQVIPSVESSNPALNNPGAQKPASAPMDWWLKLSQIWQQFKWWIIGGLAALLGLLLLSRRSNRDNEQDYYANLGKDRLAGEESPLDRVEHSDSIAPEDSEVSANPLHEAGVYINYGRYLQAQRVLELASENGYPDEVGIKLMLAEIHSKTQDYDQFDKVREQLRLLTNAEGSQWAKVEDLAKAFDPAAASREFSSDNQVYGKIAQVDVDEDGYRGGMPHETAPAIESPMEQMKKIAQEMDDALGLDSGAKGTMVATTQHHGQESDTPMSNQAHSLTEAAPSSFTPPQVSPRIEPAFTQEQYHSDFDLSALSLDLGDHAEAGLRVDMSAAGGNSGHKPGFPSQSSLAFDKLMRAEALKSQGDIGGAKQLVEELLKMDLGNLTDSVKRLQRSLDA